MRNLHESITPPATQELQTLGGEYRRFESTFRPAPKTPKPRTARGKGRTRTKPAKKR